MRVKRQQAEKNQQENEAGVGTEEEAGVGTEKGAGAETEGGVVVGTGTDAVAAGATEKGDAGGVVAKKDEDAIAKKVAAPAETRAETAVGVNPGKRSSPKFPVLARYSLGFILIRFLFILELVLQIYNGKVSNVVAFGCFVQLDGLAKRWEGLVHISQLRKEGRVTEASEVVQRGQKVKASILNSMPFVRDLIKFWYFRSKFLPSRDRKFHCR